MKYIKNKDIVVGANYWARLPLKEFMMKCEDILIEDLENLIEIVEVIKDKGSLAFVVKDSDECDILTGYDLFQKYYSFVMADVGAILTKNNTRLDEKAVNKHVFKKYQELRKYE